MAEPAAALGIELRALVEMTDGSADQVLPYTAVGDAADLAAVRRLADGSVVTVEHEHVPAEVLDVMGARPGAAALRFAQDKITMRQELGAPMPTWFVARTSEEVESAIAALGGIAIAKTPRGGYDGRGVTLAHTVEDIEFFTEGEPILLEEKVEFDMEVAVLLARRPSGQVRCWPVTQTIQKDGVCYEAIAPAQISPELAERAREIATSIAHQTGVVGVLAVEMFVAGDELLINELAMRPHNSGHWTIDGAVTSQFEQHLRAVLDLPLGSTDMTADFAVMVNLLESALPDPRDAYPRALANDGAKIHIYGKEVRPRRKIGHVTVTGSDLESARERAHATIAQLEGRS